MSCGSNKKSTKSTSNKNSKEDSSVITMEKIEEMLEQKVKSYEENTKSYLAANNELISKIINKLNGKLTDLQASVKHSDEVKLEIFKSIDRDVQILMPAKGINQVLTY